MSTDHFEHWSAIHIFCKSYGNIQTATLSLLIFWTSTHKNNKGYPQQIIEKNQKLKSKQWTISDKYKTLNLIYRPITVPNITNVESCNTKVQIDDTNKHNYIKQACNPIQHEITKKN